MIKKSITLFSILALIVTMFLVPTETKAAAQTLAEFEAEVKKYTQELEEKKNKIAKNDAEVAEIKKRITNIENQIKQAEADITNLEQQIKKNEEEIIAKKEESKKIMEYYQIANGDNAYLEYAFGSTSITDMIYRMSVVEQLTEYNDQVMKDLKVLIEKNKQQQETLAKKKVELNDLKKSLQSEKERIDADTSKIKAGMPGLEEQIKSAKEQVAYLKKEGCYSNETINACMNRKYPQPSTGSGNGDYSGNAGISTPSTNGFYRPMQYGYITQGYGGYGGHLGIDLSSSNKAIPIYPIANGIVTAKYYDNYGALVLKIRHNVDGRIIYSTYAHMRSWDVNEGQFVTPTTRLGLMGSTGYSTGPHLHLEITTCDWKSKGGGCTWAQYQRNTINPSRYVQFPSSWSNR